MKKILLLTTAIGLSTPALAQKDIILSYSSAKNTANDSTTTGLAVNTKVTKYNGLNIRVGVMNEDYSSKNIKSDATVLGATIGNDANGLSWNIGGGLIKSDWTVGSAKISLNGKLFGFGVAKEIKAGSYNFKPELTYSKQSYDKNNIFSTLETKRIQWGFSYYGNIKPNMELGVFTGRRKLENKMVTVTAIGGVKDFSSETNWFGIIRPYITYTMDNGAEINVSYEQYKYKKGGKSKTTSVRLGYNF